MKTFLYRICLTVTMFLPALAVSASDFEVDGIQYDITSFTDLTVTASSLSEGAGTKVIIPETVDFNGKTLRVTALGNGFAKDNSSLESVIVNATIEAIPKNAFYNCTKLQSATIKSVKSIEGYAFFKCETLSELIVSDELTTIGQSAFQECVELETIPQSTSLSTIEEGAFNNCSKLNHIDISQIQRINDRVFAGCSSLNDIKLSDELAYIGFEAFRATAFESFVIPNSVSTIKGSILSDCPLLTSLTIGSGISKLEYPPCGKVTNLIIADAPTQLEIGFVGSLFKEFTYDYSGIHNPIFIYIYYGGLHSIDFEHLYLGRELTWSLDPFNGGHHYVINPFYGHNSIKSVELGPNVTELPSRDLTIHYEYGRVFDYSNVFGYFEDCKNLEDVTFIGHPNSISENMFKNTAIHTFDIPNSCNSIGSHAFEDCLNLRKISIGKKVSEIGDYALANDASLNTIDIFAINPPTYASGFNNEQYVNMVVNIPTGYLAKYQQSEPWKNFWNLTEDEALLTEFIIDSIRYEIIDSNSVSVINFENPDLTSLEIPAQVDFNGKSYKVSKLDFSGVTLESCTTVILPATIETIPDEIFSGWNKLNSVELGQISSIGENAFNHCDSLEEIEIPYTCTSIGEYAFMSSGLKSISLGGVATIGQKAFVNTRLTQIEIPSTCNYIGNDAFSGCVFLSTVIFEESASPIVLGCSGDVKLSSSVVPHPNPSDVDDARTGFRNGYYDGLFYGLPIERLIINRDIELATYYARTLGQSTYGFDIVYDDIIYYPPFYGLEHLKYVEIGNSVSAICKNQIDAAVNGIETVVEYSNFGGCNEISIVVANNPAAPIGGGFSTKAYEDATLFLPNGGLESYKNDEYWGKFINIMTEEFVPVEAISFSTEAVTIDQNSTFQLTPSITPQNASITKLTWESSDSSIVEVSDNGMIISSDNAGDAVVSATTIDGSGLTASVKVTVKDNSGIDNTHLDDIVKIAVKDGMVYLSDKSPEQLVNVYDVHGQLILTTTDSVIRPNDKGVFIIEVDGRSFKVIL